MAVTFPNSPTLNQEYTAENGLIYIWDGQKWKTQGSYVVDQGNLFGFDGRDTNVTASVSTSTVTNTIDSSNDWSSNATLTDGSPPATGINQALIGMSSPNTSANVWRAALVASSPGTVVTIVHSGGTTAYTTTAISPDSNSVWLELTYSGSQNNINNSTITSLSFDQDEHTVTLTGTEDPIFIETRPVTVYGADYAASEWGVTTTTATQTFTTLSGDPSPIPAGSVALFQEPFVTFGFLGDDYELANRDSTLRVDGTIDSTGVQRFSGGVQLATSSSTLDDYEEGTWTPTLYSNNGSLSVVYNKQSGTYEKIGRQVTVRGVIILSTSTSTGDYLYIGGLPYDPAPNPIYNLSEYPGYGVVTNAQNWSPNNPTVLRASAGAGLLLRYLGDSGTASVVNGTSTTTSTRIEWNATYYVN